MSIRGQQCENTTPWMHTEIKYSQFSAPDNTLIAFIIENRNLEKFSKNKHPCETLYHIKVNKQYLTLILEVFILQQAL